MSRSGYSDDIDSWALIKWRGQVASATRGKRGQKLFIDLLKALDEMPVKRLVSDELITTEGEFCTLGVLGKARGLDIASIDPEDGEEVAKQFDIAPQLAQEIVYMNDEGWYAETPEGRYIRMRSWVAEQINPAKAEAKQTN